MDISSFLQSLNDLLDDSAVARIILIVLCLLIAQLLIKLFTGVVIHRLMLGKKYNSQKEAEQREHTLVTVFTRTSAVALWLIGICLTLSQLSFNWAGLAAGAGVIGIVIGFGAQKIAGDFLAGFFILLENQYSIGDIVEVKDMAYGVVERIDLRTTHIRNLDGGLHIIANGEIVNMANHSYGWSTAVVYLWLNYTSDVDKVEKLVNKISAELAKDETWGKEMKDPITFNRVEDYGSDGLKVSALGKTMPGMQWGVAGEFRRRLKPELDKAGIEMAYPHRIVKKT